MFSILIRRQATHSYDDQRDGYRPSWRRRETYQGAEGSPPTKGRRLQDSFHHQLRKDRGHHTQGRQKGRILLEHPSSIGSANLELATGRQDQVDLRHTSSKLVTSWATSVLSSVGEQKLPKAPSQTVPQENVRRNLRDPLGLAF